MLNIPTVSRKITKEVIVSKKLVLVLLVISLLALPLVGCAKPVTFYVSEPKDGATVTESPVTVRGSVSDAKATMWLNDTIVAVTKTTRGRGAFSTTIALIEGENTIEIVAAQGKEGKWKNVMSRTVTVTYSPK